MQKSVTLTRGKGDFIRRDLGQGKVEQICECVWNADFTKSCLMRIPGYLLPEVVKNGGHYNPERLDEYIRAGVSRNYCVYCYAARKNSGKVDRREVTNRTVKDFEQHHPKSVRLGKLTEAGHVYTFGTLRDFFELAHAYGSQIIFPTKALSFGREGAQGIYLGDSLPEGREVAKMLKACDTSLNYSIVADNLDIGAASQGYTNRWRIAQAAALREQGVNATLTVTCDVTRSIQDNIGMGFSVKEALHAWESGRVPVRLLPLRMTSHRLTKILGLEWEELVHIPTNGQGFLIGEYQRANDSRPYEKKKNNELAPRYFHSDFNRLIDAGVGVCGGVGEDEHCDFCNIGKCFVRFPKEELVKVSRVKEKIPYLRPPKPQKPNLTKPIDFPADKSMPLFVGKN